MDSLIVITTNDTNIIDIFNDIDKSYSVVQNEFNDYIIQHDESHVFINTYNEYQEEYEEEELSKIYNNIQKPKFYTFEYNNIDFAYNILKSISQFEKLMIDDDHGNIFTGEMFFKNLETNLKRDSN